MDQKDKSTTYKYLCLDSGALIKGYGMNFHLLAEKVVTIQEVLNEIRDEKSRHLLATLPYEIVVMSPSPESLKKVIQFAQKSGDYAVLSITDLKLIALTYTLEASLHGESKLRSEPKAMTSAKKSNPSKKPKDKPAAPTTTDKIDEKTMPTDTETIAITPICDCEADKDVESNHKEHDHSDDEDEDEDESSSSEEETESETNEVIPKTNDDNIKEGDDRDGEEETSIVMESPALDSTSLELEPNNLSIEAINLSETITADAQPSVLSESADAVSDPSVTIDEASKTSSTSNNPIASTPYVSKILSYRGLQNSDKIKQEDDGQDWISIDNLKLHQAQGFGGLKTKTPIKRHQKIDVVCMTTDFAMQNVLMQIGLHVASIDGKIIDSVKSWVLRCNGCFKVHFDMQKLFCSSCGLNYLSKIGCHIDSNTGELKLHLKKNYRHDLRGTIYSLPAPGKQGRFDGDLLLREDQLFRGIWRQKTVKIKKNISSAFGEDITDDVGININKGLRISVGYGRKNPNAEKGRERRGKRK